MEQYHSIAKTPLKFHKFFWYVLLPLNFISTAITFYQEFSVMTEFTWLFAVDAFFFTASLFLMAACFVGFFGWKPYAWYSVMAFLGLLVVSGVCTAAIYTAYDPEELAYSVGQLLAAILEAVLIGKYYQKRRPLFFSHVQPAAAAPDAMDAYYLEDDADEDEDVTDEAEDDDEGDEDGNTEETADDEVDVAEEAAGEADDSSEK